MTAPGRQIAVVTSDDDLSEICRMQAAALKITYGTMDRYTGFTEQFWSKKLAACSYSPTGKRGARRGWSSEAFQAALVAFCFDLIAVHNPDKEAKLRAWMAQNLEQSAGPSSMLTAGEHKPVIIRLSARHMKKLSKLGVEARKKIPLWKRRAVARKAARARWRRQECVAARS